jgi:hypothetical protein
MKRTYFFFLFLLSFFLACKNKKESEKKSENNIDAARNFIRAALDGKFAEAKNYLLQDSVNLNYIEVAERSYQRSPQETKDGYRTASINIHKVTEPVTDSVTVVIFSNSFKNDHDTLKILNMKGKWLVDLKYLYQHDEDTSLNKIITRDSLSK